MNWYVELTKVSFLLPWYVASLCLIIGCLVYLIICRILAVIARIIRHWDIKKHGWPPAHCDSDGDPYRPPEPDDDDDDDISDIHVP